MARSEHDAPDRAPTKGQRTRFRILEAGSRVLMRLGFHQASTDRVATEACVAKAAVYHYFKTKESLAVECVRHLHDHVKNRVFEASFAASEDPGERLDRIFTGVYEMHRGMVEKAGVTPGCPFVNLANEMSTQSEPLRRALAEVFDDLALSFETIYQDARRLGLSTRDARAGVVGKQVQNLMNGAMTSAKVNNRAEEILEALPAARAIIGLAEQR